MLVTKGRTGQAMIIAVLSLGGAILGATTLAGFLLLYNIRATADSVNSAKAIFAADAGLNWSLYSYYQPAPEGPWPGSSGPGTFSNGATLTATCYDASDAQTACDNSGLTPAASAITEGFSQSSRRAFSINLVSAVATLP